MSPRSRRHYFQLQFEHGGLTEVRDYLAGRADVLHSCVGVVGGNRSDCRRSETCPVLDGAPPLTGAGRGLPYVRWNDGKSYGAPTSGCSGSEVSGGRLLVAGP